MSKPVFWTLDKHYLAIIEKLKERSSALVLTVNNFKGGVGKSTLIVMLSYIMVKFKIKILLIDSDPQRTLTKKLKKNFEVKKEAKYTFMEGIQRNTLAESITQLDDYLFIVEGDWELSTLDRFIRLNLKIDAEYFLFKYLIEDLKKDYDMIIFDAVPTTTNFTHNSIVASDLVIAPTQSEDESYDNTISYMSYLSSMKKFNPDIDILGIVPYLSDLDNTTNVKYLKKYYETFDNLTFQHIVKRSARVMTWATSGITETQGYDKQTLTMYFDVFKETLDRLDDTKLI
ncbi:ATPase [Carnobacterium divergens]|uniref:ParA family protein n=1 Tax=Carnobacterium divergens TaxID=2748 RepID=UPI001072CD30|nr:ParA family protein [Carnobacterium divergens]MDT1997679.1 ParA family protein [Carnobacterium divergens]TFI65692.1 ATPase [Carnobacterium divergens]TFI77251.1 ATPase [Carnobacterium divergens]TFI85550.1 ATPase [Carnobacterium divergens]TFI94611.1 ATPase [Carnobacterium divergens]